MGSMVSGSSHLAPLVVCTQDRGNAQCDPCLTCISNMCMHISCIDWTNHVPLLSYLLQGWCCNYISKALPNTFKFGLSAIVNGHCWQSSTIGQGPLLSVPLAS